MPPSTLSSLLGRFGKWVRPFSSRISSSFLMGFGSSRNSSYPLASFVCLRCHSDFFTPFLPFPGSTCVSFSLSPTVDSSQFKTTELLTVFCSLRTLNKFLHCFLSRKSQVPSDSQEIGLQPACKHRECLLFWTQFLGTTVSGAAGPSSTDFPGSTDRPSLVRYGGFCSDSFIDQGRFRSLRPFILLNAFFFHPSVFLVVGSF